MRDFICYAITRFISGGGHRRAVPVSPAGSPKTDLAFPQRSAGTLVSRLKAICGLWQAGAGLLPAFCLRQDVRCVCLQEQSARFRQHL